MDKNNAEQHKKALKEVWDLSLLMDRKGHPEIAERLRQALGGEYQVEEEKPAKPESLEDCLKKQFKHHITVFGKKNYY